MVVHEGSSMHVNAGIVCPLNVIEGGAVVLIVGTVKEVIVGTHQTYGCCPLPRAFCPFGICLVARVAGQARGKVDEGPLRNCIPVVETIVECKNLPFQTTSTLFGVPSRHLRVEDCLRKGKPLWLILWRIGVPSLRCRHGCHSPEALIVVPEGSTLISGHVVSELANLM